MASVRKLQKELLEEYGCDEYPLVITKYIKWLTDEELKDILKDKNIDIKDFDRQFMEDMLQACLEGSNEVVTVNLVKITDMGRMQLEAALKKIRESQKTIREAQQELAQNCGYADDVIWDL